MLRGINQRLNKTELQKSPWSGKIKPPDSKIPLTEENFKTSDIITIGAKPAAETLVPFKANYAGIQEQSIKKHLESYTLHDGKTGDNYSLKANNNGVLAIFPEEPGNDTGVSVELKSNQSISLETSPSLLSPEPDEYYFFSR